jgi:tetratricopeptide (TPR) repeat protein
LDYAEKAIDYAKDAIKHPKLAQQSGIFAVALLQRRIRLNMERGNYEGAELFYSTLLDLDETEINKVECKFHLGRIFLHSNRMDKAKEAFEYVIENGNKTFFVEKAKSYLSQCGDSQ